MIHVLRMRLLLAFFVMLKIEVDESESLSIGQRRSEKTVVIKLSREKVRDFSRKAYWSEVCRQNPSLLFIDVIQRLSMAYIIGRNEWNVEGNFIEIPWKKIHSSIVTSREKSKCLFSTLSDEFIRDRMWFQKGVEFSLHWKFQLTWNRVHLMFSLKSGQLFPFARFAQIFHLF